ncbi:uncharacterized protein LOC116289312 [Actinia tenebrosa]|uniref:Uncharacterized protein LOC116289312 n=1 Tax=Actinia tenebrosa TaxID=6105 RepID=A0A6P8HHL4_ACTTE|nr:uncharacterized protein LOC116289312 [Actinia tenebrosa]
MSTRQKTRFGTSFRSFIGYAGLEVVSDEGSPSHCNQAINNTNSCEYASQEIHRGLIMDDLPSYGSLSVSDMQLSNDQQTPLICHCQCNKSSVSTFLSFFMMVLGIILVPVLKEETTPTRNVRVVCQVIRAAGLFGFTGGVTNWIAVKLIFSRIPRLFCSGALFKYFVTVREVVADFIIEAFFSSSQVKRYMQNKIFCLLDSENFDQSLLNILNSEKITSIVEKKLNLLMASPEGLMLQSLGVTKLRLRPVIMSYITDMRSYTSPLLIASLQSSELSDTEKIRGQIIDVIATRTQQISPQQVQQIITEALYKYLSSLVVWGNLFGAIVGCIIEVASIYTRGLPR